MAVKAALPDDEIDEWKKRAPKCPTHGKVAAADIEFSQRGSDFMLHCLLCFKTAGKKTRIDARGPRFQLP